MLGEKIGEEVGKTIGQRVLSIANGVPTFEVTIQGTGKLYGNETTSTMTYTAKPGPGGTMQGEGSGVFMTKDGEAATCRGIGIGKPGPGGAIRWVGSLCFQATGQKLARLNTVAVVFEHEAAANGDSKGAVWEWK